MTDLDQILATGLTRVTRGAVTPLDDGLLRAHLLDTVGCLIAGAASPVGRRMWSAGGAAPTAAGGGGPSAALFLGTSAHAHDYDDYAPGLGVHPGAVVVPALLAQAWSTPDEIDAARFVSALRVGYQCALWLAMILRDDGVADIGRGDAGAGFHATGVLGPLAAAASCTVLAGGTEEQLRQALGASCSFASGRVHNFPSDVKAIHAGHAAWAGLLSSQLALNGVVGHPGSAGELVSTLSGVRLPASGPPPPEAVSPSDLAVKEFASCGLTQRLAAVAREARSAVGATAGPDVIERVEVHSSSTPPLTFAVPSSASAARFSVPYVVACVLARGRFGLAELAEASDPGPDVVGLLGRMDLHTAEGMADEVRVVLGDGSEHGAREEGPDAPDQRWERAVPKFRASLSYVGVDPGLSRDLEATVSHIGLGAGVQALVEQVWRCIAGSTGSRNGAAAMSSVGGS